MVGTCLTGAFYVGNGWVAGGMGVAGMITTSVTSDYGSFLHSLLNTSKMLEAYENGMFTTSKKVQFFFHCIMALYLNTWVYNMI